MVQDLFSAWVYGKGWQLSPESTAKARHAIRFYALWATTSVRGSCAHFGTGLPQGGQLMAVFYPLGHPMSKASEDLLSVFEPSRTFRVTLYSQRSAAHRAFGN
jgi:hypothetical protein